MCSHHSAAELFALLPLVPLAYQPLFFVTIVARARDIKSAIPRMLELIDWIQEPELLEKAICDILNYHMALPQLSEDRIEALLKCAETLPLKANELIRMHLGRISVTNFHDLPG